MLRLIIGNKVYSSWSMRGWLAVKQSGLPFDEVVLSLYDDDWPRRRAEADLQPSNGRVPTLWDGDIPLWDSLAIIEWLAEKAGADRFWPKDPAARALARSMAAEMHSSYQALRQQHTMNLRHRLPARPISPEVEADVARISALWTRARDAFGAGGDYLFGAFGAADIMFAPVATRFATYAIPLAGEAARYNAALLDHPLVREWYDGAARETWVIDRFEPPAQ